MFKSTILKIVSALLLLEVVWCRSNGPPQPQICDPSIQLIPQHAGTAPQTTTAPFSIEVGTTSYVAGATINIDIRSSLSGSGVDNITNEFRGFMIQARPSADGPAFGTFRLLPNDDKSKLFGCPDNGILNTASHRNPNPVESVTLNWGATQEQLSSITEFNFYYTVVTNFSTYWVKLSSDAIQVEGAGTAPSENNITSTTPSESNITSTAPSESNINITSSPLCLRESYSLYLIKAHGCIMCVAWGLLAPIGILIAMFYKVIWPNGEWFYSHLGIMIGTLVLTICGLVLIIVHASGTWLSTTSTNLSHQVLGIFAAAAVGINPFIAILRCDPSSPWRWVYNWTHGFTGLILGQVAAFCAMLLGLNIYRECATVNVNFVHYAIYTVSATVGAIITIIAFYNIYSVNYRIHGNPEPRDLISSSEPPGSFPTFNHVMKSDKSADDDEIDDEPSEDFPLRAALGIGIIVLLFLLTVANVVLLAHT